jgi:hypothetical protein
MNFNQTKLTRSEWNSIEIPLNEDEIHILKFICKGYDNVNLVENDLPTIQQQLKMTYTNEIENYIYIKYFKPIIDAFKLKFNVNISAKDIKLKKADIIRLDTSDKNIQHVKETTYEFIMLSICQQIVKKNKPQLYYSLYKLNTLHVSNVNKNVKLFIDFMLNEYKPKEYLDYIFNANVVIEQNQYTFKYQDKQLYEHQKKLFNMIKQDGPQLILYSAPTGTGKTLSPLGLSEQYKVIFICAARHVGLALARASISIHKKIAFAFGCTDAGDIRLHYFAAKEVVRDKRNGTIRKVDNSVGDNVEIIICDIQSYLPAMRYMMSFNPIENIILYWDEPTITMDYKEHELHKIIHQNWNENEITKVVLSSATLPTMDELSQVTNDFMFKFPNGSVHHISTFDCKKTIRLIDTQNKIVLPHYYCETFVELKEMVDYIITNKTLLRYLDLQKICEFIEFLHKNKYIPDMLNMMEYFDSLDKITIDNIKIYYITVLRRLDNWEEIYTHEKKVQTSIYESSIKITTNDAWTLTDGPTIYMTNDVNKIASYCLQSASIPSQVFQTITEDLRFNNSIATRISVLSKDMEDKLADDAQKEHKMNDENRMKPEIRQMKMELDKLYASVRKISLHDMFVPNTKDHLKRFNKVDMLSKSFASNVDPTYIEKILTIDDIEDNWKILLMLGIGVFAHHNSDKYVELMKELATKQYLYLIIADTDYIYGTNYQFCHSYFGKDLNDLTQEKIIQAMGRVGRGKLQQSYSIRLRTDDIIKKLFTKEVDKLEVTNMNVLFSSD